MGRLVGRDVTRCACKKMKKKQEGVQQEVREELCVLNGVKDGWWGPHNWKGEKIRQADGGFGVLCFFLFSKNVLSSFNSSQHQSEDVLPPPPSHPPQTHTHLSV